MKGQSKRFVDHKGRTFGMMFKRNKDLDIEETDKSLGFLDLWRYSTWLERSATFAGVLLSWCLSVGLIAAVVVYGEFTGLFVRRHTATEVPSQNYILKTFNGGTYVPPGNRSLHMDALVQDSNAFALASAVIILIQFSTAAFAVTLANWAASRMVNRLRCQLLRTVLRQEVGFFDTNSTLNFASTVTEDMEKLRQGVGEHVVMTTYLGGSVVAGGSLAMYYGWQLTLAGLAVVPFSILVAATVAKYQTRCSAEEVTAYSTAGRVVEEALAGIRTVRAYAGEQVELDRYKAALAPASQASRRRGVWAGAGAGAGWLLTYTLNAVVFGYGTVLCVRHMHLPPDQQLYHSGTLLTILFCTFMSAQNVAMCHPHLEIFSTARGAAKSLFRLLERKTRIDALRDEGIKPDSFRGDIIFDNVFFNYPARPDVKVLRGLNLRISAGETVAFVGGSGCGKSTLLQLLQRLYDTDSGSVSVDGRDVRHLHLHHYRSSIGVVGQEPVLFSGTIRDNITLGAPHATDRDVIEAATLAHAHQFISKLEKGYETMLGESGAQLSGGQKQRVAIARALITKPTILLLDEPTSALDPAAEAQVQAALDAASKGRTTLVVSHRLSTIVNASRIVFMEQGSVLEAGTHTELLAKKGAYHDLLQRDLTTRSIATTHSEGVTDDEVSPPETPFKRALSRSSTRSSMTPEHRIRRSSRLGSVSAHVPHAAVPDLVAHVETELEDSSEPVEEVSTWRLLKLNSSEWPLLAGGAFASLLVGVTMPVFAILFSKLYGMFSSPDPDVILYWGGVYAGLFALVAAACGVVTFLQTWLFNVAGSLLTDRLRELTFQNYLRQEQAWFDRRENSVGSLCARLAAECAAVQGATGSRLGTVLQGVSTMTIGVTLSMAYSWKMTLVSLLSVPCVMGGIYLEGYVNKRSEVREKEAMEEASRIATEALINVRTVQSLGVEETILSRYVCALQRAARRRGAVAWLRGPVYGLCLAAPTLGYTVSLAYGGYLIAREDLQYEYAILVSEALIYGAWMLAEALSFAPNFAAAKRSGARIVAALERAPAVRSEPRADTLPRDWSASGEIAFRSVSFGYGRGPVLRGLRLRVPARRSAALVGASGCGKSTLLQLLLRNYDPQGGCIELDGHDIKTSLPLSVLRSQIGLVQQEPVLFDRTVRENIAYGDNSRAVSMDEVIQAAKEANVHGFISSLPNGYETRLSGSGGGVSGGQKQRVCVARALLRRPAVLLLDEPTSALDANSEQIVQEALEKASKDRTTIIIAHRLATIKHVDTIYVIDKGTVAESGSHDELVQQRGLYWQLLQQQGAAHM